MLNYLKKTHLREYARYSNAEMLAAPIDCLRGLSATQLRALKGSLGIERIEQLLDLHKQDAILQLNIDPQMIENLICVLLYPKHDPGPPCRWARLFDKAPLDSYLNHPAKRFRTEFGPVFYRGRLDGSARVLIVGQDPSTDELLGQRTLVGDAGQKLQGLLRKLGLRRSYLMLNMSLFGITGQFDAQMQAIALEPAILDYRNRLFDRCAAECKLEAILAFGNGAQFSVAHWPGSKAYPVIEFHHPSAPDNITLPNWNAQLAKAHAAIAVDPGQSVDLTPYGASFTAADSMTIPREDLPFGLPAWHGTQGTRSHRNGAKEIVWTAP